MKIKRKSVSAEVPAMAMGDIAFLLLIFFVILARVQDDSHLKWDPSQLIEVENVGYAKASVVIDTEETLYLNGNEIGVQQLADALKNILGEGGRGDRKVFLKCHKKAIARRFEPAIEAISEAGGELVHVLEEDMKRKK